MSTTHTTSGIQVTEYEEPDTLDLELVGIPESTRMYTHERTVWVSLPVQVEFTYQPAERPERGPDAQYPGCPEAIEIEGLYVGRAEITAELTDEACGEIETAVWDVLREERAA